MSKKISIGKYNSLFSITEVGLQSSWQDLGINLDGEEIDKRLENNKELQDLAKDGTLPPSYYLYKKNANSIVDKILEELGIEVVEE